MIGHGVSGPGIPVVPPATAKRKPVVIELEELRARLEEAESTLSAIRNGEVDALVVSGQHGEKVYTLQTAETPYRALVGLDLRPGG